MPDAIEVLEQIEWSGWVDWVGDGGYPCCPLCRGPKPLKEEDDHAGAFRDLQSSREVPGHLENCQLASLIMSKDMRPR
jgi:hypothetical protein